MEGEGSKEWKVLVWEVGNKTHGVSGRRGKGYIGVGGRREECWIRGRFWVWGESDERDIMKEEKDHGDSR